MTASKRSTPERLTDFSLVGGVGEKRAFCSGMIWQSGTSTVKHPDVVARVDGFTRARRANESRAANEQDLH